MPNNENIFKLQYEKLVKRYREEIIDWNEKETKLLYQLRAEMVTSAQLHRELENTREIVDSLLSKKTVEKSQ